MGSSPYQNLDSVPDAAKLGFAGLLGSQAKCASRLAGAVSGMFNVQAEIEEFVGTHLVLEATERTLVGQCLSRLGEEVLLGRNVFSVQDKIRLRIFTKVWRNISASYRQAICASLWPIWYSSIMASSSTGTSSLRYLLALSSQFGSERSANLMGQLDGTKLDIDGSISPRSEVSSCGAYTAQT